MDPEGRSEEVDRSAVLPELDLAPIERRMLAPTQTEAVRGLLDALRA
jgi:hypothetical protein